MKLNRGALALLLAILIWGSTLVLSKIALLGFGPLTLTLVRFVIAYLIMFPLAARQGYRVRQSFQGNMIVLGLTGVALYFNFQNIGLMFTSAMSASLILAAGPIVITLSAILFLNEKPTRLQMVGIGAAVMGVVLISLAEGRQEAGSNPLLGFVLFFLCMVDWSIYTVLGKRFAVRMRAMVFTEASIGSALFFMIPFAGFELAQQGLPAAISTPSLLATLYLGAVASAVPLFLWNYSLRYISASQAAAYLNLVPIVGVISALAAGESIVPLQIVGGIITIGGVLLSNRSAENSSTAGPSDSEAVLTPEPPDAGPA